MIEASRVKREGGCTVDCRYDLDIRIGAARTCADVKRNEVVCTRMRRAESAVFHKVDHRFFPSGGLFVTDQRTAR